MKKFALIPLMAAAACFANAGEDEKAKQEQTVVVPEQATEEKAVSENTEEQALIIEAKARAQDVDAAAAAAKKPVQPATGSQVNKTKK